MSAYSSNPAFPVPGLHSDPDFNGMTLREYAAIHLRIPDSGSEWLDTMIRRALLDKIAQECIGITDYNESSWEDRAAEAYEIANAMLKARSAP